MIRLKFWRSRATRSKWIYEEERDRGIPPIIGALYVSKEWLEENGDPEILVVTLAAYDAA